MTYKIAINEMALTAKLPQGDPRWAALNDSFVNREVDSFDLISSIYAGHPFTTWHNGRRKLDNFICGQHIGVDLDTGDERSTIATLQQHRLVRMYASFVYTTPSHTPEAPRARVVFLLDEPIISAEGYSAAASFLSSQFDGADTAVHDASRFFYGSKGCETYYPDGVLPVRELRVFYARWKAAQPKPAQRTPSAPATPNQHKPEDFEKATAALQQVDPYSVDYNRWIGIIAAMKREFGDAALPVVERWAQGRHGEVALEWKRLRINHRKAMRLGTIFHLAKH